MNNVKKLPPTSTFHIYLQMEEAFNTKIIKLSQEIGKKYKSEFIVGGKGYKPHITLYIFAAPIRNTKLMVAKIKNISEMLNPPDLTIDQLILSWDGWLMLDFKEKDKLFECHEQVIKALNPLREGILRRKYRSEKALLKYPKEEIEILKKHGERHAMSNYHPHVSLAKIINFDEARSAYGSYKNKVKGEKVGITSLEFVRIVGDDTRGVGKLLYSHNYGSKKLNQR